MNSVRPALIGLAAGALAYAGMAGFLHSQTPGTAAITDTVIESVSPSVSVLTKVTRGDKTGDRKGDTVLSPVLSPKLSVTPRVTTVVTPRTSASPSPSHIAAVAHTPTPQVTPRISTPTPRPTPNSTPTPSPSPTPAPTATPEVTAAPTPEPTAQPAPAETRVVINEVAWAGTAVPNAGASDEWFELYNAGESEVDLTGWTLHGDADSKGVTRIITLSGHIAAGGYFLIERTDDMTVSDIGADVFGAFGGSGLRNDPCEPIELKDAAGTGMDSVGCSAGDWFAGSASPDYASMERIDPLGAGSDPSNWASNDGAVTTGEDAAGQPIRGTPKFRNSGAR